MFESIISDGLTLMNGTICVITSIILGIIIGFIHMKCSKYSKNFITSLAVLPLLVATIMIMVNGNLGTGVAIAGAFSLVRFRSMQGTSREIISIFWAMTIGIAIGMGQIVFAILVTVVVAIVLFLLNLVKYGETKDNEKILEILVPESLEYDTMFDEIFPKYTKSYSLLKVKTANLGSLYELRYSIYLKENIKIKEMLDEFRILNGNLKICLHKEITEELL